MRFVTPDEFKAYETIAYAKGFLMVSASPLTRSSHHAGEDFARLRAARAGATTAGRGADAASSPPTGGSRHSADEMFELVADVEAYPQFVPLCERLTVRGRDTAGRPRGPRRRHDGRLQGDPRDLHHAG